MNKEKSNIVVIGTYTVMDGYVVRWYGGLVSAAHGRETISASRNGVYGHDMKITRELFEAAYAAHEKMAEMMQYGKRATAEDFADILTHKREGFDAEIKPIEVSGNQGGE